jgi:glucose-6-phosphate-specific signal transduction histidine kinase
MLEFFLVIAAWRRGWKGWALVPSAIGYSLLFLLSSVSDSSDGSGLMLVIAVGVLVGLIFMIANPRTTDEYASSDSNSLPHEPAL